jgi:predicted ATPase/DNA-binding winged helix-turn-helix (wHTH) protein
MPETPVDQTLTYTCCDWEVDLAKRELRLGQTPALVGSRAFEVLAVLVRSAGETVERDVLAGAVWPGVIVEENRLQAQISALRKALGPDRDMLKTVSGRGYVLTGDWTPAPSRTAAPIVQAKPAPGRRNAIPPSGPALIGRDAALANVLDRLATSKVVTLTGPGGIGKTSLALEAGRRFAADGEGVLVELASIREGSQVASAVANALGISGIELSPTGIAQAIRQHALLLVLDNCEHVIEAAAAVSEAVAIGCPDVRVLATSREVLRVAAESTFRVPPLEAPPEGRENVDDVLGHSAVQLFIARCAARETPLRALHDELTIIAGICRRLDGIPLALEFAAGRVATLGLHEVAARLDDRFNLLTGGRRTALARHQTLRAALDWSYDLLEAQEQRLLRRLSIFAGRFSLGAAESVAGMGLGAGHDFAELVSELVQKSLVTMAPGPNGFCYRMLDTIRAYAKEKLEQDNEMAPLSKAHAEFLIDYLSRVAAGHTEPGLQWPASYGEVIIDVRAALLWAFGSAEHRDLGVQLTAVSTPLWIHMSLVDECSSYVQTALANLRAEEQHSPIAMILLAALAMSRMYIGGNMVELAGLWSRVLDIADQSGDRRYIRRALWGLSSCNLLAGQVAAAKRFAERHSDLAPSSDSPSDRFVAGRLLGQAQLYGGDLGAARESLEWVLRGAAEHQGTMHVLDQRVMAQSFLSRVLWLQGYPDQALQAMKDVVTAARSTGHGLSICLALTQSACYLLQWTGDLVQFAGVVDELNQQSQKFGLAFMHVPCRCYEGRLQIERGELRVGRRRFEAAFEEFPRTSVGLFRELLCELAITLDGHDFTSDARGLVDAALAQFELNGEYWYYPEALRLKGMLLIREAPHAAETILNQALAQSRQQAAMSWELRCAISLGQLLLAQQRRQEGLDLLVPLYDRFEEGFGTADLIRARQLIAQLR